MTNQGGEGDVPLPPRPATATMKPVDSARHICDEARVVLSHLRAGPPAVSRGELSHNLHNLRRTIRSDFLEAPFRAAVGFNGTTGDGAGGGGNDGGATTGGTTTTTTGDCGASVGSCDAMSVASCRSRVGSRGSFEGVSSRFGVAIASTTGGGAGSSVVGSPRGGRGTPIDLNVNPNNPPGSPKRVQQQMMYQRNLQQSPPVSPTPRSPSSRVQTLSEDDVVTWASPPRPPPPPPRRTPSRDEGENGVQEEGGEEKAKDDDEGDGKKDEAPAPPQTPEVPPSAGPAPAQPSSPPPQPQPHQSQHHHPLDASRGPILEDQLMEEKTDAFGGSIHGPTPGPTGSAIVDSTSSGADDDDEIREFGGNDEEDDVGRYARPFLDVVVDPRAAGPQTLAAVRALHRLLERGSLLPLRRGRTGKDRRGGAVKDGNGHGHVVALEPLARGVIGCRFEQTDAGADEAVEMAIADLLSLLVSIDAREVERHYREKCVEVVDGTDDDDDEDEGRNHRGGGGAGRLRPETRMEAFKTVFVNRNTYVHSPALCYHFDTVLTEMVTATFGLVSVAAAMNFHRSTRRPSNGIGGGDDCRSYAEAAARPVLEFLVQQLLHTPLLHSLSPGSSGGGASEAQVAHDATRVLCLKLTRCALRTGWGDGVAGEGVGRGTVGGHRLGNREVFQYKGGGSTPATASRSTGAGVHEGGGRGTPRRDIATEAQKSRPGMNHRRRRQPSLLEIVQDDLCLSLLMTGQALGSGLSLEVLSEVCATVTTLWSIPTLRRRSLQLQVEAIFTGLFQRALVLLRQRPPPGDSSVAFVSNSAFDSECEIILETLVDILCLHDDGSVGAGAGSGLGALEELYVTYDCDLNRSDVAEGLILELCRCCGGPSGQLAGLDDNGVPVFEALTRGRLDSDIASVTRQVPAHLKELCAEALSGGLKSLFGHASETQFFREQPTSDMVDLRSESPASPWRMGARGTQEAARSGDAMSSVTLRPNKQMKQTLKRGAILFNRDSTEGIKFLASSGAFPSPVTPRDVALFLRQGIVFGLDKAAVGEYLGAEGKGPKPGKNPHDCERDWFHRSTLVEYCALFNFDQQSLLDCLRMFLSSFRLPGEAQQIDRILQTFAERCAHTCEEAVHEHYFSDEPKKASDAAYLLAFSIIMLNTDLHNTNIKSDRKMTVDGFVLNNTNYGRDITDEGKELPREYLEGIYESIKEEEIRTEPEGAEGIMTVERWKDVLRSHRAGNAALKHEPKKTGTSGRMGEERKVMDVNVLQNLILETTWLSVVSAIGGFWSASVIGITEDDTAFSEEGNSMLNTEGARLGMELAFEMLSGVRIMNRRDIFQSVFQCICHFTGLLQYRQPTSERSLSFVQSIERQSAVVVIMNTAKEYGDFIGSHGWKYVWAIVFELRDLRLLGVRGGGLLGETDPDLLSKNARNDRTIKLMKDGLFGRGSGHGGDEMNSAGERKLIMGGLILGAMGRMFFGEGDNSITTPGHGVSGVEHRERIIREEATVHGKEKLLIWDYLAPSDDEEEDEQDIVPMERSDYFENTEEPSASYSYSAGAQLIHEDHMVFVETPRNDPAPLLSRTTRVRRRLAGMCDFYGLVAESRFLTLDGIRDVISALMELIKCSEHGIMPLTDGHDATSTHPADKSLFVISPASEALAEVLICEITLKNRDRVSLLWDSLNKHYVERLGFPQAEKEPSVVDEGVENREREVSEQPLVTPGIEKCVTGLVRLVCCMVHREEMTNEVVTSLSLLHPPEGRYAQCSELDKHRAEGLWRTCRNVDGLALLKADGWDALLGLVEYCALLGGTVIRVGPGRGGLAEDDPTLQAFRCLHLILHTSELEKLVPFRVVQGVRALLVSGERGRCAKLCIAALDLLLLLHSRMELHVGEWSSGDTIAENDSVVQSYWPSVLEGMAEAARTSAFGTVRQHALSMLTDAVIDRHGKELPAEQLFAVVHNNCVSVAGFRISVLLNCDDIEAIWEEVMIELKLCISLVFKPFLHHLKTLLTIEDKFASLWESVLNVMEQLLGDETAYSTPEESPVLANDGRQQRSAIVNSMTKENLLLTTKELGSEHLRNAVMVLMAYNVLDAEESGHADEMDVSKNLSALTWKTIGSMGFCGRSVDEWKCAGMDSVAGSEEIERGVAAENVEGVIGQNPEGNNKTAVAEALDVEVSVNGSTGRLPDGGEDTCEGAKC